MIWFMIYKTKSINSLDLYQNIFLAIKSLKILFCYILPIYCQYSPYLMRPEISLYKVSTILYVLDQCSDTKLWYCRMNIYNGLGGTTHKSLLGMDDFEGPQQDLAKTLGGGGSFGQEG